MSTPRAACRFRRVVKRAHCTAIQNALGQRS